MVFQEANNLGALSKITENKGQRSKLSKLKVKVLIDNSEDVNKSLKKTLSSIWGRHLILVYSSEGSCFRVHVPGIFLQKCFWQDVLVHIHSTWIVPYNKSAILKCCQHICVVIPCHCGYHCSWKKKNTNLS